ncbi:MAG: SDR family oxidoreductase [Lachnospiraceae bacterium]|nr:SDR family oxidoreductase [Lachnospiraceae bacterium]
MSSFSLKSFDLQGKKAIVTGAGRDTGLCYGMAKALHTCGAEVVLYDVLPSVHDTAKQLGETAPAVYGVEADLNDAASRTRGFHEAVELLGGRLDILVNGAGMQYRCKAIDYPEDKWEQIINVNLSSMFFLSQMAAKIMIPAGKGKIINIASMNSFLGGKIIPAYASSKGGVMQMTKALSNEWCGLGVNVNAIAPGYYETELTEDLRKMEQAKDISKRIPAGRWGKPEDLSGAVVFLASEASDYVSGAILAVDGGALYGA